MGIRNMNKLIRAIAPQCIREFYFTELKGKRLAVDALIFIYEVKYRMKITKSTFRHVFQQKLIPLTDQTNKIIFVFDGQKVKEKNYTVWKRKMEKQKLKLKIKNTHDVQTVMNMDRQLVEVYPGDIYEAKDILKQRKLMIVQSSDEGEATCVKLVKDGHADMILTNDTDCLAFGHSYIHRKCRKVDELPPSTTSYLYTDLPQLRRELGFTTHEQFVDMCVMLGCDFSDPLKKLVYHKIPAVLREHKSLDIFLKYAAKVNLPHFTTERNCPKALLKSKDLFVNILGSYSNSLPLNHREHHLQILLGEAENNSNNKEIVALKKQKHPPSFPATDTMTSLPKKKPVNGGENRGIFQEPITFSWGNCGGN